MTLIPSFRRSLPLQRHLKLDETIIRSVDSIFESLELQHCRVLG